MGIRNRGLIIKRGYVLRIMLFIYDAIVVNAAYLIALILRFSDADSMRDSGVKYLRMFGKYALWYTMGCLAVFLIFHLYNIVLRYTGVNDVKKLVYANVLTCVLYVVGSLLIVGRMPISMYVLGAVFQFILMSVARLTPRYL